MYSMSETNWGIHLPPSAWEQRKLGEMGHATSGVGFPVAEQGGSVGIPFFKVSDMNIAGNESEMVVSANYVTLEQIARKKWRPVLDVPAMFFAKVGAAVMLNRKRLVREPFLLDNNTMAYSMNPSSWDVEFAKALFGMLDLASLVQVGALPSYNVGDVEAMRVRIPCLSEQRAIGAFFRDVDHLITLRQCKLRQIFQIIRVWSFVSVILAVLAAKHYVSLNTLLSQCKPPEVRRLSMSEQVCELNFADYYEDWIATYKEGAIRKPTMAKYKQSLKWVRQLAPNLLLSQLTRQEYQKLLNEYALVHEHQTTMDFHHQLKGSILDAVDEGLLARDPTRKAIIKGKQPTKKKPKYLSQLELHKLLTSLELTETLDWDWFILLVAKTGMRFSEALALTPGDFDFSRQMLTVNKTWDYKDEGGFAPTKNQSSVRKIQMDWQLVVQFSTMVRNLPSEDPIFVQKDVPVYNSTVNGVLERRCRKAQVPVISIHGLRHTHASLLLYAGVSMASVARRLGHSSMTTTQKTYLHIIQELENQDVDLVMRSLSSLV